jgi:hypothetical protein
LRDQRLHLGAFDDLLLYQTSGQRAQGAFVRVNHPLLDLQVDVPRGLPGKWLRLVPGHLEEALSV